MPLNRRFISRARSSVVSLLKGKRPKTRPLRWNHPGSNNQMKCQLTTRVSLRPIICHWNKIQFKSCQYCDDMSIKFHPTHSEVTEVTQMPLKRRLIWWDPVSIVELHLKGSVFGRFPFKRETTEDRALEMKSNFLQQSGLVPIQCHSDQGSVTSIMPMDSHFVKELPLNQFLGIFNQSDATSVILHCVAVA